jgi:hypothetical protein
MAIAVDPFRAVIDRGFCGHLEPGMWAVATTSSCRHLLATCTSRQANRGQTGSVAPLGWWPTPCSLRRQLRVRTLTTSISRRVLRPGQDEAPTRRCDALVVGGIVDE